MSYNYNTILIVVGVLILIVWFLLLWCFLSIITNHYNLVGLDYWVVHIVGIIIINTFLGACYEISR